MWLLPTTFEVVDSTKGSLEFRQRPPSHDSISYFRSPIAAASGFFFLLLLILTSVFSVSLSTEEEFSFHLRDFTGIESFSRRKYEAHGHLDYCTSSPSKVPLTALIHWTSDWFKLMHQDLKNVMKLLWTWRKLRLKLFFFFAICHFYDYFVIWFAGMYLSWHKKKRIEILPKNNFKNLPEKRKQKISFHQIFSPKTKRLKCAQNHQKRMLLLSKWATNIWKTTKHSDISYKISRAIIRKNLWHNLNGIDPV